MNKVFIVVLFLLIAERTIAQSENFLDSNIDSLVHNNLFGVYLTHQEFLKGLPSFPGKFEIVNFRTIRVTDERLNKMKRLYEDFWCALDANDIYLMKGSYIYRLVYTGRYNICNTIQVSNNTYNGGTVSYSRHEEVVVKMVDLLANKWYPYSVGGMKKILKTNNQELYREFMYENNKKSKLAIYFRHLNN